MAKMSLFLGGFLVLTILIGLLAYISVVQVMAGIRFALRCRALVVLRSYAFPLWERACSRWASTMTRVV
jgi:chromate transport protein ChrA